MHIACIAMYVCVCMCVKVAAQTWCLTWSMLCIVCSGSGAKLGSRNEHAGYDEIVFCITYNEQL